MLACSEIENVERIAAQLQEAKKEADRTAGEAAAAVSAAQDAAERVTALAADLEHAKAEADSFALIAELEAAKEDADNAAAYWSDPTDVEDCRIHCHNDTPVSGDSVNENIEESLVLPQTTPFWQRDVCELKTSQLGLDSPAPRSKRQQSFTSAVLKLDSEPAMRVEPPTTCTTLTGTATQRKDDKGDDSLGAGCYLVFEEQDQGTLTATWSRTIPTSISVSYKSLRPIIYKLLYIGPVETLPISAQAKKLLILSTGMEVARNLNVALVVLDPKPSVLLGSTTLRLHVPFLVNSLFLRATVFPSLSITRQRLSARSNKATLVRHLMMSLLVLLSQSSLVHLTLVRCRLICSAERVKLKVL